METAGIRKDDIIEYDVRGQRGYALVSEQLHHDPDINKKVLTLKPLGVRERLLTRHVTSMQVKDHWRKKRARKEQQANEDE